MKIDIEFNLLLFKAKTGYALEVGLTKRELEIIHFLLKGMTAKETARQLLISPRTTERHLDNIRHKLNCRNKIELVNKILYNFYLKAD